MKRIFIACIFALSVSACKMQTSDSPAKTAASIPDFSSISKLGNSVYSKDTGSGSNAAARQAQAAASQTTDVFISGKADGQKILFRQTRSAGTTTNKGCIFDGAVEPPSSYPCAFAKDDVKYLLFSKADDFALYTESSETDTAVSFTKSSAWNFSAITAYIRSITYNGKNEAWVFSPEWSEARQTLYFTLAKWVSNATKGDYISIRVYQSKLSGTSFLAPTETTGEIDPYNPVHYTDGQTHNANSFPGRMGIGWIGRLYVTQDGNKAFFTSLNVSFASDYGILKTNDPWIFPEPNSNNFGSSGITDVYDSRLIQTAIYQADIDANGNFVNLAILPESVNQGGINFVSDISADGTTLMVSHMDTNDDFWAWGWGADGLALHVCQQPAEDTEQWAGYIIEYRKSGSDWTVENTIGKEVATGHSSAYLENLAKFNAFNESTFRSSRPWIPTTSTIAPTFVHGKMFYNIEDHPDMSFVDDSELHGTWTAVDFVDKQSDFRPGTKSWADSLYWTDITVNSDGSFNSNLGGSKWTKGIFKFNMTGQEYTILQSGADAYLFVQWKSGDYTIRGDKPSYYVFKKN